MMKYDFLEDMVFIGTRVGYIFTRTVYLAGIQPN